MNLATNLSALAAAAALSMAPAQASTSSESFFTTGDGVRMAYRIDGPADRPVLILSNSIGTSLHMWDGQIDALARNYRVVRYDMRGHGASGAPAGAYSLDRLGRDALELMDELQIEKAHFLGLSLGGFVGQWLGIHAPERIDRLVLANTASYLGPAPQWDAAIGAIERAPDMKDTAEMFLRNWFPTQWLESDAPVVREFRAMLLAADRHGIAGAWAAVRDADLRRTIALITRPTLVIAGRHDTVTAASHGEAIAAAIPGARLVVLPVVHLSNIEQPERFIRVVTDFLKG